MNEGIRDLMFFWGPHSWKKNRRHTNITKYTTQYTSYKKNLSPAKACSKYNSEYINSVKGDEIILKASHYHYKPFIDKKEGAIA